MIRITINNAQVFEFPNTVKGNRDSRKLLEGLRTKREHDIYYFLKQKITRLEDKIKFATFYMRKKMQKELDALLKQRQDAWELIGDVTPPPQLVITIETI